MIQIRCCHSLDAAAPQRAAINALNLASARPDPFSTFEFYQHVLRHAAAFPPAGGLRLWLLLAFSGEVLVGYAALKQSRHRVLGLPAVKLDWLTGHIADRPHLVAQPGQDGAVAAALNEYLLGRRREWSLLEFQQQEDDSPLLPPVLAHAPGCKVWQWPNLENGTIELCWRSTAEYFAALSKKARSNVSRQMRSLLAAGRVQLLSSADRQTVTELFALYREIEPHSWKARAGATIGGDRPALDFYTGLMDPAQPMHLSIQVLLLDGAPIAGLICGAFDRSLYALHIVYDERHAGLAPGSAILLMGVRLAIEGGYRSFNLLRGASYYKTRWLAQIHPTRSLQIYRTGTPFFWRRALGDAWRRARGRAAPLTAILFNPVRRGSVTGATQAVTMASPAPSLGPAPTPSAAERTRQDGLVARILAAPGEHLAGAELAAVLPFETMRASA